MSLRKFQNIKAQELIVLKENFFMFPVFSKTCPLVHYFNKLDSDPLGDAKTKYQGSRLCGFREEEFFTLKIYF